jgi:ATP phosphoribosyltransferase
VGNRRALAASAEKRELTRRIVELIEARLRAQGYYSVTANMRGTSEREVADALLESAPTRGMRGPTVARVYTAEEHGSGWAETHWFAATIIVGADALQSAIDHVRQAGGSGMSVVPVRYLFDERSQHFARVLAELGK